MSEDYASMDNILKYYGKVENRKITKNAVEIPFIFYMAQDIKHWYTAQSYKRSIEYCIQRVNNFAKGEKIHPNWIVSTCDRFVFSQTKIIIIILYFQYLD